MGNCWVSFSKEANTTTIHGPTSPGVSTNTSHSKEISATRSTGKSQFSDTVNEDGETATAGEQILETPNLKIFSFADLKLAAKNFKSDRVIGEGVSGKVYLGWIDEKTFSPSKSGVGMVVAIKKLSPEGTQGFLEWQIEDNFPARLSHPTLVKLFGYCREDKELLLVYEFMQNGTLDKQLFRRDPSIEPLSWDTRLKIAIGAARGLVFLHISKERVIYRDFRTSSILLDGSFNAKLGNFGLAKLGPTDGESHVTTRVMGTYGYVAPEYLTTGHLYVKSDVYSFGVVLLEMLTGLMVFDTKRPRGEQNLVDWMKPMLSQKKKLQDIMDRRIEGQYSTEAARKAAQLALKCLNLYPKRRPSMTEVLEILEHVEAMK